VQAFRGVWRIQEGAGGDSTARLSYALFVRPQVWLPVRLIQARSLLEAAPYCMHLSFSRLPTVAKLAAGAH